LNGESPIKEITVRQSITYLLTILLTVACSTPAEYNVQDFGAKGDGKAIDSPAINKAIQKAASNGGGRVVVPAGKYMCYSIRLESDIELHLVQGAVIISARPTENEGYDAPEEQPFTQYQAFGHNHVRNSLIWGHDINNVSITGRGMINGCNLTSWNEGRRYEGNKAIAFRGCRNVTLNGITIYKGGHFAVHSTDCDNLHISDLRVDTDRDGINIICCKNVSVSNCLINGPQDDCIVLKSNYSLGRFKDVENVSITGCVITGYQCGSMLDGTYRRFSPEKDVFRSGGRIKLGTESSGGYKNIAVSNIVFDYCGGLMLQSMDGGHLEDVTFSNITFRDCLYAPIFLRIGERMRSPEGTPVGHIKRVNFSNITAYNVDSWNGCVISGTPGHYIEDVTFSNIHLYFKGGYSKEDAKIVPPEFEINYPEPWMFGTSPSRAFFIRHAKNIHFDNIYLDYEYEDGRPDFALIDTEGVTKNNIVVTGKMLKVKSGEKPMGYAGSMDHVANSVAASDEKLNAGSSLFGEHMLKGCCSDDKALAELCEEYLTLAGFAMNEAKLSFLEGATFTFANDSGLLPATWNHEDDNIDLSFSKVFSCVLKGKVETSRDGSIRILFPAGQFQALMQRVICLAGRMDTNGFMDRFDRQLAGRSDITVGFEIL